MLSGILEKWPDLGPYLPDHPKPASCEPTSAKVLGRTTHPRVFKHSWADSPVAVVRFALTPALPDGFFAIGVHSTAFEHLFVMWARGGRRFHFRDFYAGGGWDDVEGADLPGKARANLRRTLAQWESSQDRLVSNRPFVPPGMDPRTPRPLDMAIAHVVAHELGIATPEWPEQGGPMTSGQTRLPRSVSEMRSMVMTLMSWQPEGPADMRIIVQALATACPQNFGDVVPVTPEYLAKLESERNHALAAVGRVQWLHKSGGGSCAACGGVPWPCPTWRTATSPPEPEDGEVDSAC